MKKYILNSLKGCMQALLICLSFAMTACSNDLSSAEDESGMSMCDININALIDRVDAIGTRAGGDGTIPDGYCLRIILEFYAPNASGDYVDNAVLRKVTYTNSYDKNIVDGIRLPLNVRYKMLAWADYVPVADQANLKDCFYGTSSIKGLREVTQIVPDNNELVKQAALGNDADDAYCANCEVLTSARRVNWNITLKRPLCKLSLQNVKFISNGSVYESVDNARMHFDAPLYVAYDVMTGDAIQGGSNAAYSLYPVQAAANEGVNLHHYFFVPNDIPEGGLKYGITLEDGDLAFGIDPKLQISIYSKNTSIVVSKQNGGTILFKKF